jgi:signal transduction histidine kinase
MDTARAQTPYQERDYWIRFSWIWSLVYISSLLIPAVLSALSEQTGQRPLLRMVILIAAGLIWHWLWVYPILRKLRNPYSYPALMAIYLSGLVVVWFGLVRIDPIFYIQLSGLYPQIFIFLPAAWAIPATFLMSGLIFIEQARGDFSTVNLQDGLFWLLTTGFAVLFYLWIRGIIAQSEGRGALIQELETAQAELAASERKAGILSERQRLAQEIHDTLAQGFTSIVLLLEAAEQALPLDSLGENSSNLRKYMDQARQTARDSLEQARRLVWELRPQPLEEASLPEAIKRTAENWAASSEVPCQVEVTGEIETLHPQVEITLLRAVQESLANIRRHAQASQVNVTLSYMGDVVVLDVHDDGVGFDPRHLVRGNPEAYPGYGLTAMRERVEKLGGTLLIESAPGEGTTLAVKIPVSE